MAGKMDDAIAGDLHALVAAERHEVIEIQLKVSVARKDNLAHRIAVGVTAIGREAHHFAFVAVLLVTNELAHHGVEASQRMRNENTVEHLDFVSLAACKHGGHEVTRAVIAEAGGLVPPGAVIGAGDVRDVVLEVMNFEAQAVGGNLKCARQKSANVLHRFLALAETDEVENLGRFGKRVLHFLGEVGVAVLADGDMVNVGKARARGVEASADGEAGKSAVVLDTVEALLGDREQDLAVLNDGGGGIGVKHVETKYEHNCRFL